MSHIAVDPGKSGGLVYVAPGGVVEAVPMPDTPTDVCELLRSAQRVGNGTLVIEQIPLFTGKNIPSSTTAVLFENFGIILGVAIALGMRIERVRPQDWQKVFGVGTSRNCDSKTEWKNKLKSKAQELFPQTKVTLATADSLLIFEWYRRKCLPGV